MKTKAIMSEPASSAAASAVGWKLIGGLTGLAAAGAALAALVVMCMTPPRSKREWAVGLTSTVVGSIAGGAAVVQKFGLTHWAESPVGLVAMLGIVFACGLPAWALVRWLFNYINKRSGASIDDIVRDVHKGVKGE